MNIFELALTVMLSTIIAFLLYAMKCKWGI